MERATKDHRARVVRSRRVQHHPCPGQIGSFGICGVTLSDTSAWLRGKEVYRRKWAVCKGAIQRSGRAYAAPNESKPWVLLDLVQCFSRSAVEILEPHNIVTLRGMIAADPGYAQ